MDPIIFKTRAEAATFFDVSLTTFDRWLAMGAPGERGNYPMAAITHWLIMPGGINGPKLSKGATGAEFDRYHSARMALVCADKPPAVPADVTAHIRLVCGLVEALQVWIDAHARNTEPLLMVRDALMGIGGSLDCYLPDDDGEGDVDA